METVGGLVALVGIVTFFVGHMWLVFIIGRENRTAGLIAFLIFITSVYFIRNRWSEAKYPIYALLLGVLIFIVGGIIANFPIDA